MGSNSLILIQGGREVDESFDWRLELEDYVDCVGARLIGWVPYAERERLRGEARDHLECLVLSHLEGGASAREALRLAFESYGSSDQIAREYLQSWYQKQGRGPLISKFGHDTLVGVGWFSLAQIICSAVVMLNVFLPGESALRYLVDPNLYYAFFPSTFPLVEVSPIHFLLIGSAWLAPLAAGWMVGWKVPTRPGITALKGVIPCFVYTLVAGLALLPSHDMLVLAAVQILWWVPSGALASHLSSAFSWKRRCRYKGRLTRGQK